MIVKADTIKVDTTVPLAGGSETSGGQTREYSKGGQVRIVKAISLLTPRERFRGLLVMVLMCISALSDMVAVAAIMPFLAALANPEMIHTNRQLDWVYEYLKFTSDSSFVFALGVAAFFFLVVAAAARSVSSYAQNLFTWMRRHTLSCRLLEGYLHQPYSFFLGRHSGELSQNLLSEVDMFVNMALGPVVAIVSSVFVLTAMVTVLVIVDPLSALIMALVLATSYTGILYLVRPIMLRIGEERLAANRQVYETTSEALTGIKTIKVLGREDSYVDRFRRPSLVMARHLALNYVLGQLPRFVVEAVAFGGIILLALTLMARSGDSSGGALASTLPILGLYALAGYRMMPAVHQLYLSMATLRFAGPVIDSVAAELQKMKAAPSGSGPVAPLSFTKGLTLRDLEYRYPGAAFPTLMDINLELPKGSTLGIVGTTGAGKTTLVDVMLGLLEPTSGAILIDGEPLSATNRSAWQRAIGYVPQEIFVTDRSIAENIALGVEFEAIDLARVEKCARMAQIHQFVVSELPDGYLTTVGERGIRLSGGQRQRIGIARALYHDPAVIIFDEATSALDNLTEAEVMDALDILSQQKTIVMIAHRLSTVQSCDRLLVLEHGRMVGYGTYQELSRGNAQMRRFLGGAAG